MKSKAMNRILSLGLAAALLLCGLPVTAFADVKEADVYNVTGTITGTSSTGPQNLSGAIVNIADGMGFNKGATTSDGAYTISGVPAGMYTLVASMSDYETKRLTSVTVNSGNTTGKDITLNQYYTVSGIIEDSVTSNPIAAAAVTLKKGQDELDAQTGPSGEYSFPKMIISGIYTITVDANGYDKKTGTVTIAEADDTSQNFALTVKTIQPPASTYTVTVLNDGNGTAWATPASATAGRTISLTATPNTNYSFSRWETVSPPGLAISGNSFSMPDEDVTVKAHFERTYTQTDRSSDSGGSRSGNTTTAVKPAPATEKDALDAFNKALSSLTPGQKTVTVRFVNSASIPPDVLKAIADAAKKAGVTVIIHADTVSDGAVQTRLYIDPAKSSKGITLAASADSPDAVNAADRFKNRFANKLAAVSTGQQGSFGQPVGIAVKVDLTGMDTENLVFYSYDQKTNTHKRIEKPAYWIDKNGYLHFTTELAGEIIISDGPLEKKS